MRVLWALPILFSCIFGEDDDVSYVPPPEKKSISPKKLYNRCLDEQKVSTSFLQVDKWINSLSNPCYEKTTLYTAPEDHVLRIQCLVINLRCSYEAAMVVTDVVDSSISYLYSASDSVTTKGNRMSVIRRSLYSPCTATCTITSIKKTNPECNCGGKMQNPIGGSFSASDMESSWHVYVYTDPWRCSGALISRNWVLTAASCRPRRSGTFLWIGYGKLYDWKQKIESRRAEDVYIHNSFFGSNVNDIALIRMDEGVEFNSYIQPICLPFNIPSDYGYVHAAGWGFNRNNGHFGSRTLRKTILYVISNSICRQKVASSFTITSGQICAEMYRSGECYADTGSSLVYEYNGQFYSIGVKSIPNGNCGYVSSVFTRVASYLSWIEGIVDDPLCK